MKTAQPSIAATLWGDGLIDDTLSDFRAVTRWDACAPDEYVFVFPRLVPAEGKFPAVLRHHLMVGIAVLAWRIACRDPQRVATSLRSLCLAEVGRLGRSGQADWFAKESVLDLALGWLGLAGPADAGFVSEASALLFLDDVLWRVQQQADCALDLGSTAYFAFHSGIHPIYLCPAAFATQARDTAAGWLGHLNRGRSALMPKSVAEYFVETVGCAPGHMASVRDPKIAQLIRSNADAAALRRAAVSRLEGKDVVCRLSRPTTRWQQGPARLRPSLAAGHAVDH